MTPPTTGPVLVAFGLDVEEVEGNVEEIELEAVNLFVGIATPVTSTTVVTKARKLWMLSAKCVEPFALFRRVSIYLRCC